MFVLDRSVDIKPVSKAYSRYFRKALSVQVNCMEGAYRAGKTVINVLSFACYLEGCKDKIHLVSGASEATAKLNVADCNGLGLMYLFKGRCKSGRYQDNACLKIATKTGEKIIIFVGGGKSDSYKKIQGLSFGSWLSVEVANLYISDDEKCFIDMAISRLTQSHDRKIWWDLNPVYPTHKIYKKYLDVYEERSRKGQMLGGYNYIRCSLYDNNALSPMQKEFYASTYPDKESMEYKRFILGERAAATGIIFREFALNRAKWVVNDLKEFLQDKQVQFLSIGVDFGGNKSNTTFVATAVYNNFSGVIIVASDIMVMAGGEADAAEFRKRFKAFIERVIALNIAPIKYAFGDCADRVMIAEMRNVKREMGAGFKVLDSVKRTIIERIKVKKMLISLGKWFVFAGAKSVIDSTSTQVWNPADGHEDERLDDGSCDLDTEDGEEYSWSCFIPQLIANSTR